MERLVLEGTPVIFKNFSGEKGPYNPQGARSFSLLFEDLKQAENLIRLGWALKPLKNEEEETDAYHLPVKINYSSRQPPRIYRVTISNGNTLPLEEKTVGMLDFQPIEYVDISINPYSWEVKGERGVKAYCQTMYAVIQEDELDLKWTNFFSKIEEDSPF